MLELFFFIVFEIISIYLGVLLIWKQEYIVQNAYNKRIEGLDIFKDLKTLNDKIVSEKEKIHGKHICYFIGVMAILISLLILFLKVTEG